MRTSAIIPAALMDAANARLEFETDGTPTGFGPNNFTVALGAERTHAGLSCGNVTGFLERLLEMEASGEFPGLVVDYSGKAKQGDEKSKGDFREMTKALSLEPWDGDIDSLPMKGDQRTADGKTWESTTDYNVWEPGVSGWREVVAEGYPEWRLPTGAHDAYALGDRVEYKGADYESRIAANVWSPSVYPAGWKQIVN